MKSSSLEPPKSNQPQQQTVQRPTTLQTYPDDYENITSTSSSTSIHHKQIPEKPRVIQQPVPSKSFITIKKIFQRKDVLFEMHLSLNMWF